MWVQKVGRWILDVKSIRILVEIFSFYQFRESTPCFVKPLAWQVRHPLLENRAFVPVYNYFLSRFLNRDRPFGINTCISFVPEAIEPGQMLISRTKKIRSLAPAYGSQLLQIQNQSQNQLQSQINHSQNQLSQLQTIFSQINPFTYTYLTKKKRKQEQQSRPRRHRVGGAPTGPSHPCRCSRLGRALAAARQPHPHQGGSRGPEG